jgi:hypothetical protein
MELRSRDSKETEPRISRRARVPWGRPRSNHTTGAGQPCLWRYSFHCSMWDFAVYSGIMGCTSSSPRASQKELLSKCTPATTTGGRGVTCIDTRSCLYTVRITSPLNATPAAWMLYFSPVEFRLPRPDPVLYHPNSHNMYIWLYFLYSLHCVVSMV